MLQLVRSALATDGQDYADKVAEFEAVTQSTYQQVQTVGHARGLGAGLGNAMKSLLLGGAVGNPEGQYDGHSQIVFRLHDQNGLPVKDYSIYFNSLGGESAPKQLIDSMFEDRHRNNTTPHVITFYLRTKAFDGQDWNERLAAVNGVDLEIDAMDAETQRILFVPLRLRLTSEQLQAWIQPNRTTIIDVELLRLPSEDTFVMF